MRTQRRQTAQKIRLFRGLFYGLSGAYGTYDPKTGRVWQVKQPVADRVIYDHLRGVQPYGVYLLVDDKTGAVAVDFDDPDVSLPVAFVAAAWKARRVVVKLLADIGKPHIEVFPKQDRLTDHLAYGNYINTPLFGRLVPQGRTVFVDPEQPTQVYPDQWDFLTQVERTSETQLDAILQSNPPQTQPPGNGPSDGENTSRLRPGPYSLPPCIQHMLTDGVAFNQRIACFRLAVALHKIGIPRDLAEGMLQVWAAKNRPADGKRIITADEIREQVRAGYRGTYHSYGCDDEPMASLCDPSCPIRRQDRSIKPTGAEDR